MNKKVDPSEINTWTSALHFVPKPDGSLSYCGDYRDLNLKTLLGYPLPSLQNFVGNLLGAKFFSKIDLVKAYHQIPI